MDLNLTKLNWFVMAFLSFTTISEAQEVLVCGSDGDNSDKIAFTVLRDFNAGEIIFFTEDDYQDNLNNFQNGEGHIKYTVPIGGLSVGVIVTITETSTNTFSVGGGGGTAVAVGTGNWSFSTADEIYAYSASDENAPWDNVTEVHSFLWTATTNFGANQDPSNDYPSVIIMAVNFGGAGGVAADFKDGFRTGTTRSMLEDPNNWNKSSSGGLSFSLTPFVNLSLPIELSTFSAQRKESAIRLKWETQREYNNDYFELQRSTNGKDFAKIGLVNGSGTSHSLSHYFFVDDSPIIGTNYYRLKQVDFDGISTVSEVIAVGFYQPDKEQVEIFPNPFSQFLTIEMLNKTGEIHAFEVVDQRGYVKLNRQEILFTRDLRLNTSDWESGIYYVKLFGSQEMVVKKILRY